MLFARREDNSPNKAPGEFLGLAAVKSQAV